MYGSRVEHVNVQKATLSCSQTALNVKHVPHMSVSARGHRNLSRIETTYRYLDLFTRLFLRAFSFCTSGADLRGSMYQQSVVGPVMRQNEADSECIGFVNNKMWNKAVLTRCQI